ncbi:hypothetical protein PROFUN_17044 [Planoprotostelium fungivorum]|uniref:Uncharacterized protein n=1 Tax=Planoprotostelium fungivorum TaxID=1890364 RepID=A0A2P6MMI0_9EUKA|nr:hypothetical protein PROFUN_17044 [Planoprotostelium fungivorum]
MLGTTPSAGREVSGNTTKSSIRIHPLSQCQVLCGNLYTQIIRKTQ